MSWIIIINECILFLRNSRKITKLRQNTLKFSAVHKSCIREDKSYYYEINTCMKYKKDYFMKPTFSSSTWMHVQCRRSQGTFTAYKIGTILCFRSVNVCCLHTCICRCSVFTDYDFLIEFCRQLHIISCN